MDSLLDLLKGVFRSFQGGKFQASKAQVDELLHTIPLVSVSSRSEELKVKEVLGLAMEYAVAVKLELARRASTANPKRALELVAYTTHCNLKPAHLMLALNLAMIVSYKGGNFIHAATSQKIDLKARLAKQLGVPDTKFTLLVPRVVLAEAVEAVESMLALLKAEGLDMPASVSRCAHDAYQVMQHAADRPAARRWLSMALKHARLSKVPGCEALEQMERKLVAIGGDPAVVDSE
mgnify:CR=1 FL=1